ncbi:MAG: YceI family protein [Thermoanaerobaculia bacterium]|nr:YceI family protein [Thermoanaerobaculia bacterium]
MRNPRRIPLALVLCVMASAPLLAQVETFLMDKPHSQVTFRIRHVVSMVEGRFNDFDAKLWLDRANPSKSKVEFTIQAGSITTNHENRDKHLRSADFFDTEKYPTITFVSTKIEPKGNDTYDVTGDFTMRGVKKILKFAVRHGGFARVGKSDKTGFDLAMRLNRKDFNINWNRAIDQGRWLLGDDVDILIGIEANKEKPAETPAEQPAERPAAPAPSPGS